MPDETTPQGESTESEGEPLDFGAWLETQPGNVKRAIESSTAGLHNALKSEREQRKELAKQLRDATAQAEAGSTLKQQLEEITGKHEQAERRAAFFEDAGRPEIGCTNPRAAFLVATADALFDKRGEPDWKAIRAAAPELFARKGASAHAGSGTQTAPPPAEDMNTRIRRATGRM